MERNGDFLKIRKFAEFEKNLQFFANKLRKFLFEN